MTDRTSAAVVRGCAKCGHPAHSYGGGSFCKKQITAMGNTAQHTYTCGCRG